MKKRLFKIFCAIIILGGCAFVIYKLPKKVSVYTVVFKVDDSIIKTEEVEKNKVVSKPDEPIKEGYYFIGWLYNGVIFDFSQTIQNDMTLMAAFQEKKVIGLFTVNFDSNGGSKIDEVIVIEGEKVSKPKDPTRKNYTFKYWELDGREYDFESDVASDLNLKAIWSKNKTTITRKNTTKYIIKFDTDGGNKISSSVVLYGEKVSKPKNPTKEGYIFVEWQLDGKTYNFKTKVTSDLTLKAVWKYNEKQVEETTNDNNTEVVFDKYIVSFNTLGGSKVYSIVVKAGEKINRPKKNPTKEGYTFKTWLYNDQEYDFNSPVNEDIVLTALWEE